MIAREIVTQWFAVDKHLTFDPKRLLIIEKAYGNMITACLF